MLGFGHVLYRRSGFLFIPECIFLSPGLPLLFLLFHFFCPLGMFFFLHLCFSEVKYNNFLRFLFNISGATITMSSDLIKHTQMLRAFHIPLHFLLLYLHMFHLFVFVYCKYGFPICYISTTHFFPYFILFYYYHLRIVLDVYLFIDYI